MRNRRYLDLFVGEAEEHLARLRDGLLLLQAGESTPEGLRELLRHAHTLKGSAMMLEFAEIGRVAHALEDRFKELGDGRLPLSRSLLDLFFAAAAALEHLVANARSGAVPAFSVDEMVESLERGVLSGVALTTGDSDDAAVAGIVTVRADVEHLDRIVNQLGELIIARRAVAERGRELNVLLGRLEGFVRKLRRAENVRTLRDIQSGLTRLGRDLDGDLAVLADLSQDLHHAAMELRMLPLSTITDELGRMTRTLARDMGKELLFAVSGDRVELDRTMLEVLKPALLHLLRNAVDHGLEDPETRILAGKPPTGRIELRAAYDNGMVRIELADDGNGIDPQYVRRKAIERGVISPAEDARLDDRDALLLILRPGFSTRDTVSDISGRGVGMDVVAQSLTQVRGELAIDSTPGAGTTMRLYLPLTLALIPGLFFDCGERAFSVPLHNVSEIVGLDAVDLAGEGGQTVLRRHGRALPVIDLCALFELPAAAAERRPLLVLNAGERQMAVAVDAVRGVQEMVVKGFGRQLEKVEYFSGVTIRGDGLPVPILAVTDLFDSRHAVPLLPKRGSAEPMRRGRVLVVDDSVTTRTMEKNILEAHGYSVTLAASAEAAVAMLEAGTGCDLVVSDVEMPGMNGFELTALLGRQERYADLPVIIVSSLESDDDRRRGLEAGARAYIVKGRFEQGDLLNAVETLIG